MYEIELSRKAAKFYRKVDTATARRLNAAFDRLAEDPLQHYSIKPLSGHLQGSYRRVNRGQTTKLLCDPGHYTQCKRQPRVRFPKNRISHPSTTSTPLPTQRRHRSTYSPMSFAETPCS